MHTGLQNKKKCIIMICSLLAVILLAVAGRIFYLHYMELKNGTPAYSQDAVDWSDDMDADAEEGYITMPGYDTVSMKAGEDTSNIVLTNPESNQCLFQFQLILKDTDEILYTSDMVKPGKAIMNQKLSRAMDEGDYNFIIRINTFSPDGKTSYNGSDIETTLHVFKG